MYTQQLITRNNYIRLIKIQCKMDAFDGTACLFVRNTATVAV